ncbi:MAG: M56 family metallopeptidase [Pirellulaceae bacterium]
MANQSNSIYVGAIHDSQFLRDLAECTRRLGIQGHVDAVETHALGSAAIVGWRRPLLLLPTGWKSWTNEERQAVLAHELAHVKRSDFVSTAIGQLAVAMNFYHPLAHLVMQRMRLDQELAADALASAVVGGQQRYVETLAGLALRQPQVRIPGPCQAFLPPRRMFVRRLEMLRNLPRTRPWINRCYTAVAAVSLISVATLATGLRPHTLVAQEVSGGAGITTAQPSVSSYLPPGLWEAVVCVDVQGALASKGVQAILKQAELPREFEVQGYKIALEDVSEVALVAILFAEGGAPEPLMILRSKQSFADVPQVPQIQRLDEKTLAVHSSPEILRLLANGNRDKKLQELLDRNGESHIRVASKTTWLRMLAKQIGAQGPAMAFAPLWTAVDSISLGINLSDNLDLLAQLDSTDPKRVAETLTAAKFLARNYLDGIAQVEAEAGGNPTEVVMAAAAAQAGNQLLDSLEINSEANQTLVTAQLPNAVYSMVGLAVPAISSARTAALRSQSMNNMKQMLLAFHNYHDAYGHLPPAVFVDNASGAKRSWRVELLPFLECAHLYEQYRKDQPWDSDANQQVLQQMPQVFAVAGSTGTTVTPYQAIVSEDGGLTLSEGREPKFRDFLDGLSNTTIIVETTELAPWTQPVDLSDTVTLPQLGTARKSDPGIIAGMADGVVRFISKDINPQTWKALTTRSGGETLSLE